MDPSGAAKSKYQLSFQSGSLPASCRPSSRSDAMAGNLEARRHLALVRRRDLREAVLVPVAAAALDGEQVAGTAAVAPEHDPVAGAGPRRVTVDRALARQPADGAAGGRDGEDLELRGVDDAAPVRRERRVRRVATDVDRHRGRAVDAAHL